MSEDHHSPEEWAREAGERLTRARLRRVQLDRHKNDLTLWMVAAIVLLIVAAAIISIHNGTL